jgi:hypothetical protein
VRARHPWLYYSILRIALFGALLAIIMILGVPWWFAAPAAAILGLCISYIFLARPRDEVAKDLYALRHGGKPDHPSIDSDVEDELLDQRDRLENL